MELDQTDHAIRDMEDRLTRQIIELSDRADHLQDQVNMYRDRGG